MAMNQMQDPDRAGEAGAMSEMMQMMDQMGQLCEAMKAKMQAMMGQDQGQQVAAGYAKAKGSPMGGM